jgi:hypothetical protein
LETRVSSDSSGSRNRRCCGCLSRDTAKKNKIKIIYKPEHKITDLSNKNTGLNNTF